MQECKNTRATCHCTKSDENASTTVENLKVIQIECIQIQDQPNKKKLAQSLIRKVKNIKPAPSLGRFITILRGVYILSPKRNRRRKNKNNYVLVFKN